MRGWDPCAFAPSSASHASAARRALRPCVTRRARSVIGPERHRRTQSHCIREDRRACRARRRRTRPRERAGGLIANSHARAALERIDEREEGVGRLLEPIGLDRLARADAPGELDLSRCELRSDASDLTPGDAELELALNVAAALRGLLRMGAVEEKRLGEVVTVRHREEPRPEVVVLALEVLRVVAERVLLEHRAVEEHRRVEERRAEERRPADLRAPARHEVERPGAIGLRQLEHGASDHGDARVSAQVCELPLEPVRQRDVVGIEPRDVGAPGAIQRTIQRPGETLRVLVANDDEPRIVEGRENLGRPVARTVVDDEQLEILDRLAQHARDGVAQEALAVLHREEDRDERSGLGGHERTDDSLPPRGRGPADVRSHPRDGRPRRAARAALRLARATDSRERSG